MKQFVQPDPRANKWQNQNVHPGTSNPHFVRFLLMRKLLLKTILIALFESKKFTLIATESFSKPVQILFY